MWGKLLVNCVECLFLQFQPRNGQVGLARAAEEKGLGGCKDKVYRALFGVGTQSSGQGEIPEGYTRARGGGVNGFEQGEGIQLLSFVETVLGLCYIILEAVRDFFVLGTAGVVGSPAGLLYVVGGAV